MPRDWLSGKIESVAIDLLAENGSFTPAEVFDGILHGNRALKRALSRMGKTFPEYDVQGAYEGYLLERVRKWALRKDKNGDPIFIGVAVNGNHRNGVRYSMRMDASPNQLERAAYIRATLGVDMRRAAARQANAAFELTQAGSTSIREHTGDDVAKIADMSKRIREDAEATFMSPLRLT